MNKKILSSFLIYRISKKITFTVIIIFLVILSIFFYINSELEKYNYYLPKNFAYTELTGQKTSYITSNIEQDNIQAIETLPLSEYTVPSAPYENELELPIENIKYKDGNKDMVIINQNLLNDGEKVRNFPIGYLNIPDTLSNEGININIDGLNIEQLIVGEFPQKNQAIIGENLANYYLDEYNENHYSELIGREISLNTSLNGKKVTQEYELSGIYEVDDEYSPDLINEWIFINPNDNNNIEFYNDILENSDKKGLFLVFDTKSTMMNYVDNSTYEWLTYKNIPLHKFRMYVNIIMVILFNFILYLLLLREIKYIKNVLIAYNIGYINYLIIFISPFVLLNTIIFFILLIS